MSVESWSGDSPTPRLTAHDNLGDRNSIFPSFIILQVFKTTCELALYVRRCRQECGKTNKELMISIQWNKYRLPYFTRMAFYEAPRWQGRGGRGFPPRHFWWQLDYRVIFASVITRTAWHPQRQSALSWATAPLRSGTWFTTLCFCASPTTVTTDC